MTTAKIARHVIAVATVVLSTVACGSPQRQSTLATPPSPTPTGGGECPPALSPGYLPDGAEPVEKGPYFGMPERLRTWKSGDAYVQLGEGFSGDHGDEPRVKPVEVRGSTGRLANGFYDPEVISIDWDEQTRCGAVQFILVTENLSEEEAIKIAQSLHGDTK